MTFQPATSLAPLNAASKAEVTIGSGLNAWWARRRALKASAHDGMVSHEVDSSDELMVINSASITRSTTAASGSASRSILS